MVIMMLDEEEDMLRRFFEAGLACNKMGITDDQLGYICLAFKFMDSLAFCNRSSIIRSWIKIEKERWDKTLSIRKLVLANNNPPEALLRECIRAFCCIRFRDILNNMEL